MAYVLEDSFNTGDNIATDFCYGANWFAQTFLTGQEYGITRVKIKAYRVGSPSTITVSIRAVDVNHQPTGEDLISGTVDGNTFTVVTTGDWYAIDFASVYTLSAATEYAIVIRAIGGSVTNYIRIRALAVGYADGIGEKSVNSGSSWINYDSPAYDHMFETYSPGALDPGDDPPPSVNVSYSKKLVAISNDQLWYESSVGTMAELTAARYAIDCTVGLDMFEMYGKIFIANGSNLKIADFVNVKITTTDIGANPPDFRTILTGGTSGAKMIVDYITTLSGACTIYGKLITAAEFEAETVTGVDDDENAISFTGTAQVSGPHWYDWTVYGNDSSYGVMPTYATIGCNYRGRACLSGDEDYPHQWYQSRQGNPWDWNYIANDAQSPIAGGNADAGEIGDIVTCEIPYKDDYLIYGCANSIWYLIGDAAESGSIQELSLTAGILGSKAWCWDQNDNLYLLTTVGVLKFPPGFGPPENTTLESYPDFVKDLAFDSSTDRITLAYNRNNHGIHIFKTTLTTGVNSNWWFDLRTGGLFPETYPEECGICSSFFYEALDPSYRELLFGCFDGYIRFFDPSAEDDDIGATDEAIDGYVDFGPMQLGDEIREGKLLSLIGVLAGGGVSGGNQSDSNDVYYKIFVENSAEKVIEHMYANSGVRVSGTLKAVGRLSGSTKKYKIRGMYIGIRIGNLTAAQTWAMEKLLLNAKGSGRLK